MADDLFEEEWNNDRSRKAKKDTEKDPYNVEAWTILTREAQTKWVGSVRAFYERLLKTFPTCARFWKIYIEHELRSENFEEAEKLFDRCLLRVPHVELWKVYLNYVRRIKCFQPRFTERMIQAFNLAVKNIGMDYHAIFIWYDYIRFLKSFKVSGLGPIDKHNDVIRKVYQKGLTNPMLNIEHLWNDYVRFEHNVNPVEARRHITECQGYYPIVYKAARQLVPRVHNLKRFCPSIPPTGISEEKRQLRIWKSLIQWEKNNPLGTMNIVLIARRVLFMYQQCLLMFSFHPDVWIEATRYLHHISDTLNEKGDKDTAQLFSDEAVELFEKATRTVLQKNLLIILSYAHLAECRNDTKKVSDIFDKYLSIADIDPTLAYVHYMRYAHRTHGVRAGRAIFKRAREDKRASYHIYIASAQLEYFSTKEKTIAFRIFDLGLKKFSNNPDYILHYVDYLWHMREDNNVRVLFERILTSGALTPDKSILLWNKYLEFETIVGSLTGIKKVEARRNAILQKLPGYDDKRIVPQVNRYEFLNIYPTGTALWKPIKVNESSREIRTFTLADNLRLAMGGSENISKPDLSQMIPYAPRCSTLPGSHPVPGGVFPFPPAVSKFIGTLPPPSSFRGPFVSVDKLMEVFCSIRISERQNKS